MRRPGSIGQYQSGLGVAGLGLCAAGWLVLTPFAFGYRGPASHDAALTDWATGGGLAAVCVMTLVAWAIAWRRALLADGVLTRSPRRRARQQARDRRRRDRHGGAASMVPDPAQVLTALRALLAPLLDPAAEPSPAVPAGPDGIAVIKSMLAGAELLMTGFDEEEAW